LRLDDPVGDDLLRLISPQRNLYTGTRVRF
jgi:hypothetical protein